MQVRHLMKLSLASLILSIVFGFSLKAVAAENAVDAKVISTTVVPDKKAAEKIVNAVCSAEYT